MTMAGSPLAAQNILQELHNATLPFFRAKTSLSIFLDEEKNPEGVIALLGLVELFEQYKDGRFIPEDEMGTLAMRSALGEVKEKYPKFFQPNGTNDQGFLFLFKKVIHKNDVEQCINRIVARSKNDFFDELDLRFGRFFPETIERSKQDIEGDFENIKLHLKLLLPTQEVIMVMDTFLRDLYLFTVALLKKANNHSSS